MRVFLCHASEDKPRVRDLFDRLRVDGVEPWLDEESLEPGKPWRTEIPRALRDSDIVVVLLSSRAVEKTGFFHKEVKEALDAADERPEGSTYLIPALLEDCKIPDRLSHIQAVRLHKPDGYDRLLRVLKGRILSIDANEGTWRRAAEQLNFKVPSFVRIPAGKCLIGVDEVQAAELTDMALTAGLWRQPFPTNANKRHLFWSEDLLKPWFYGDSSPKHEIDVDEFYIAKFPVTRGEYSFFVADTGHQRAERCGYNSWVTEEMATHPVLGLGFSDSVAYCTWLTHKLRAVGAIADDESIRLPTEAEWEKAASWDEGKQRSRLWPWGNSWSAQKCNCVQSGINWTTPVDMYCPQGDSAYGVSDMVGNAWEWCSSLFLPYPYDPNDGREYSDASITGPRVTRGGSFQVDGLVARCSYRRPSALYGFRCVRAKVKRFNQDKKRVQEALDRISLSSYDIHCQIWGEGVFRV